MIVQYRFLCRPKKERLFPSSAYHFYAWLLEQLPDSIAELLHEDAFHPISQYLYFDHGLHHYIWVLNVLDSEVAIQTDSVFAHTTTLQIDEDLIDLELIERYVMQSAAEFSHRLPDEAYSQSYYKITFLTPTAFKVSGRYHIFPSEKLILQSLSMQWNAAFQDYSVSDEDALMMLEQTIRIVDYNLRSSRYQLKGKRIPGFSGDVVIQERLSAPLKQVWDMLARFAPFSGIGIKTTLGMGGIQIKLPDY